MRWILISTKILAGCAVHASQECLDLTLCCVSPGSAGMTYRGQDSQTSRPADFRLRLGSPPKHWTWKTRQETVTLSKSNPQSSGSIFVRTLHLAQCSCACLWLRRRPLVGSSLGFSNARVHSACATWRRTVASGRQETTIHQDSHYTSV